jgi:hypothetical protein
MGGNRRHVAADKGVSGVLGESVNGQPIEAIPGSTGASRQASITSANNRPIRATSRHRQGARNTRLASSSFVVGAPRPRTSVVGFADHHHRFILHMR